MVPIAEQKNTQAHLFVVNDRPPAARTGGLHLRTEEPPAANGKPPQILLRLAWQTVNIGDAAHTPGVLKKHLPGVAVRLWPSNVGGGVAEMLVLARRISALITPGRF